jgi:phenylalanyl-tRNA synthetase alpha chain
MKELKKKKEEIKKEIEGSSSLNELKTVFRKYLGKKGLINQFFKSLKDLSSQDKKEQGRQINLMKLELEKEIIKKEKVVKEKMRTDKIKKEKIDITRPAEKSEGGHLHILSQVQEGIIDIFQSMGFSVVSGPDVETEWYNFDALNVPVTHPARDIQDTLWLKNKESKDNQSNLLLRTQTSPVQVRYLEKHNPPFRIIVPGRVYRNEATDSSHEVQFYQCEGLMIDKDVSVANFKAIINAFLKSFFDSEIETRFRPSYFPFTEPGFEVDAKRKGKEWMEMMGAGMVHPNVFKSAGYSQENWQGFAFGMGIERLAMVKYKIDDIRLFYSGDLRFLNQF